MKESGKKIELMGREYIYIQMAHNTKVNGLKTDKMDLELNNGLTVLSMKDNIYVVKSMDLGFLHGINF